MRFERVRKSWRDSEGLGKSQRNSERLGGGGQGGQVGGGVII